MTTTYELQKNDPEPTPFYISSLASGTVLSVLTAVVSLLALLAFDVTEGSATESTLGIVAALSGLGTALFGSASMALMFRWRKWSLMPNWAKVYTFVLTTFVVSMAIYGFAKNFSG